MSQIKFGWRVPDFPVDGSSKGQVFIDQIHQHLAVVNEHFDSSWVADHFVPWAGWQDAETDSIECWTTTAFLAAAYPKLTWGTIVLCQSYRNPALMAKMAAALSSLAPGRFVFGIGAGWKEDEYRAYGYPFPRPAVRIQELEEAVIIAKQLWSTDHVTFTGKHYQIQDAILNPKPDPAPPILIGGSGEKLLLRVVAKHADWCNPGGGTREQYAHKLNILRGHCEAVGSDYDRIVKTWSSECVAIAETEEEAQRIAKAWPFCQEGNGLIGTPDMIATEIQHWIDAGVTHFLLRFADFPRTNGVELFVREVLPRFKERGDA